MTKAEVESTRAKLKSVTGFDVRVVTCDIANLNDEESPGYTAPDGYIRSCLHVPRGAAYWPMEDPKDPLTHIILGRESSLESFIHEWAHAYHHRHVKSTEEFREDGNNEREKKHGRGFYAALKEVARLYYGNAALYPWHHPGEYTHITEWARQDGLTKEYHEREVMEVMS